MVPNVAPRHPLAPRVADPVGPDLALVYALVQPVLVRDVLRIREPDAKTTIGIRSSHTESQKNYRLTNNVSDLRWVDLDLEFPWLVGRW